MNDSTQMLMSAGQRFRQPSQPPQQGFGLMGFQPPQQGAAPQQKPVQWGEYYRRPMESGDGFADPSQMRGAPQMGGPAAHPDQRSQDAFAYFQRMQEQMAAEQAEREQMQRTWMDSLTSQQAQRDQQLMQYLR